MHKSFLWYLYKFWEGELLLFIISIPGINQSIFLKIRQDCEHICNDLSVVIENVFWASLYNSGLTNWKHAYNLTIAQNQLYPFAKRPKKILNESLKKFARKFSFKITFCSLTSYSKQYPLYATQPSSRLKKSFDEKCLKLKLY